MLNISFLENVFVYGRCAAFCKIDTEPMGLLGVSVCNDMNNWRYFIVVASTQPSVGKNLNGSKTMVVRGATGRKIPHSRAFEGETLYFMQKGSAKISAKATVKSEGRRAKLSRWTSIIKEIWMTGLLLRKSRMLLLGRAFHTTMITLYDAI